METGHGRPDRDIIAASALFDAKWYTRTYKVSGDPAEHYLTTGWQLGFDSSRAFSTREYIDLYPDVAAAKMNPLLHYELYGKNEGRMPALAHFVRLTKGCDLNGKGLEIGPSFNPICPKQKGYNVEVLDHLDAEGLRKKYGNDPNVRNLLGRIEEVDYVWRGEDYRDLVGKENYYDYIIASQLIEHTTDFIGFMQQCSALLKETGILALSVPNKYYCFDFFRENTSLMQVIDKHLADGTKHSQGALIEYFSDVVKLNNYIAWNKNISHEHKEFDLIGTKEEALCSVMESQFRDIHEWVFTPGSFRILIYDLWELGYIDLYEESFYDDSSNTHEFLISLKRCAPSGAGSLFNQAKRMELRRYMLEESRNFYLNCLA